MKPFPLAAVFALLAATTDVGAFELAVSGPDFTITVPKLPPIHVGQQTTTPPGVAKAMSGEDATYKVALLVTPAPTQASTRACAGAFLKAVLSQPGMPDRDSVYRAPLEAETFLVLYILGAPGQLQLHAHLVSSVADTHCIDVHFSRALREGEDEDDWRMSFSGAHVRATGR